VSIKILQIIFNILYYFIVLPIFALFSIYFIVKILKKNKTRLNISFSLVYILTALGVILNIVYSLIKVELIVTILNFITNFSTLLGLIFLFCTNQILLKSKLVFTKLKQTLVVAIYAILLFLMIIFYPFGGGITINESTDWKPVMHLPLFIYVIVIITVCAVIPILITSYQIYQQFEDDNLKKRWAFFIIGTLGIIMFLYNIFINNFMNYPIIRSIFNIHALSVFVWLFLIYYGIGRQID
jgi:hypothetical protein